MPRCAGGGGCGGKFPTNLTACFGARRKTRKRRGTGTLDLKLFQTAVEMKAKSRRDSLFGMSSSPHDMQPGVLEFSSRPLNGGSQLHRPISGAGGC